MKLYSHEVSGNSYKIRLFLSLLNLDCEIINVDLIKGENKQENFLQLNPLSQVPVLKDKDLVLRDSQAILVYLANTYGNDRWLPPSGPEMALVMQWLFTACNEIARGPADARLFGKFHFDIDIETATENSHVILPIINKHLQDREWLELGHPTIADIACFPYIALSHEGGISLEPYEYLSHWVNRISAMPNFVPLPA